MKEYIGHAHNLALVDTDKGLLAQVELALVVSEPRFVMDESGQFVRRRETETMRLVLGPNGVNQLIAGLIEIKDKMEQLQQRCPHEEEQQRLDALAGNVTSPRGQNPRRVHITEIKE